MEFIVLYASVELMHEEPIQAETVEILAEGSVTLGKETKLAGSSTETEEKVLISKNNKNLKRRKTKWLVEMQLMQIAIFNLKS